MNLPCFITTAESDPLLLTSPKQVLRHFLKFIHGNWTNYTFYFILQSFGVARMIIHFQVSLQVFPKIKIAKTEVGGSERPQFSADYSVFKHLPYCTHGCISSMCCSVILLKISILSFFNSQLIEEGIQYVVTYRSSSRFRRKIWGQWIAPDLEHTTPPPFHYVIALGVQREDCHRSTFLHFVHWHSH
jgi:hypothetical protein